MLQLTRSPNYETPSARSPSAGGETIAIISFTNYKKEQTRASMKSAMQYASQDKKTMWNGRRLVSGYNCPPESAYNDFISTKNLYHKDGGRMFYHMVQSFPAGENVNPVIAHAAAMRLAEWYEGREVLVCTHIDREHIHSHLIINSVSFEDGRKLHISENELEELRRLNDKVCLEFGLPVFQKQQRTKAKSISTAEYHVAARGKSVKLRLMNNIDACMKRAATRDEFISLMERRGYKVRWEKNRKYITYTAPSGWQCRDSKLFDEKYFKERMEREFDIRAEIINGGTEAAQHGASERNAYGHGAVERDVYGHGTADNTPDAQRMGYADETHRAHRDDARTGWEAEREAFLNPEVARADAEIIPAAPVAHSGLGDVVGSVVQLGHAVELAQNDARVKDATAMPTRSDRKVLAREKRKKISLGQQVDDHEEHTIQQTM